MTARNCWTCQHDAIEIGGAHICLRFRAEGVLAWVDENVVPDSPDVPPSMPPRDAPPCPAWQATVKESSTVQCDAWTPHDGRSFPLCGPGDELEVQLRDGSTATAHADSCRWAPSAAGDRDDDIVAWRPK